jgi:hypothetical protein
MEGAYVPYLESSERGGRKTVELAVTAYAFLKELGDFSYKLSALDRVWNIFFPDKSKKWHHLQVTRYKHTYYLFLLDGEAGGLEVNPGKGLHALDPPGISARRLERDEQIAAVWGPLITPARNWLKVIRKDWIKANQRIRLEYPLRCRYGIAPHSVIHTSLPGIYRLDKEVGEKNTWKLVDLVESGFFLNAENTIAPSLNAADYCEYCRIAYQAGKRRGETIPSSLSGRELYKRYADGRHDGLLDLDPDSAQEFGDWIDGRHPKRGVGGHPWEIKRGGNTTHIDLIVSRPSTYQPDGFRVELQGQSISRLAETIRMFLAIHKTGRPISIADPEGVRRRLLSQDTIGIVPSYASLHRANQHFLQEQGVFDVLHYDDLGRFKRRINPFITWEPLPILKPREA